MDKDIAINEITGLRRRWRYYEAFPWIVALAVYWFLPGYIPLGTQIIIMVLFALSLDLVLGYAGIVILGHAAFYGLGAYTAGLLAVYVTSDPLLGLIAAGLASALLGAVAGSVMLRTTGLALLMLGLALALILLEVANRASGLTGGFDGLHGIMPAPLFGAFEFDFFGQTAFLYCLGVLFLCWLFVRAVVNAPFGRSLIGIRENERRMGALGVGVWHRKLVAFTLSAGIAGLAGGLAAQANQFVSLNVFSFELSGTVIVMLVLGGSGRLYGAFVGAPVYMVAQDMLAKDEPIYWLFWLGIILVAVVLFGKGGILALVDRASGAMKHSIRRSSIATPAESKR